MNINACEMDFKVLNSKIRGAASDLTVDGCFGQRYIGAGLAGRTLTLNGTPGNALGCYLDGATIVVNGNAQDAVGDTMNDGRIIIHGNAGDALGYAMRGGVIFVRGNVGYRTGIHMKQYKDKKPVIVIGGRAGSFLGEYQAGGLIIVLGLNCEGKLPIGYFTGTGMHGGRIFIRSDVKPENLPPQVVVKRADEGQLEEIMPFLREYSELFSTDPGPIGNVPFYVLTPNAKNPYKMLYTNN
jgi:glutamate synthase domain-containing protein 3